MAIDQDKYMCIGKHEEAGGRVGSRAPEQRFGFFPPKLFSAAFAPRSDSGKIAMR